ncbi:MAG: DUF6951 family protein [Thermoleophilia bacterium]
MTSSDSTNGGAADTGGSVTAEKKTPRTTGAATSAVRAEIDAGICGFQTTVRAEAESMRKVKLTIESDCPQIRTAAEQLPEMDMLDELKSGLGHGHVYGVLSGCVRHVTCPVGSGILKAAEASAGLALPKDVSIKVTKE